MLIDVEVKFYQKSRMAPPCGSAYRPHLIVVGSENYLGVQFSPLPCVEFGEIIAVSVVTLYDSVDYSALSRGAHFQIAEGSTIVGDGVVIDVRSS